MTMEELKQMISRLDERLDELSSDVKKLRHVLIEGNGTPSMTVRMALAEKDIHDLRDNEADKKMPRAVWVGILVSTIVGIVGIVVSVV